jgi:hypothetical protein
MKVILFTLLISINLYSQNTDYIIQEIPANIELGKKVSCRYYSFSDNGDSTLESHETYKLNSEDQIIKFKLKYKKKEYSDYKIKYTKNSIIKTFKGDKKYTIEYFIVGNYETKIFKFDGAITAITSRCLIDSLGKFYEMSLIQGRFPGLYVEVRDGLYGREEFQISNEGFEVMSSKTTYSVENDSLVNVYSSVKPMEFITWVRRDGIIVEKRKFEKESRDDLDSVLVHLSYHIEYLYNEDKKIVKEYTYSEDKLDPFRYREYKYDKSGNLIYEATFAPSSEKDFMLFRIDYLLDVNSNTYSIITWNEGSIVSKEIYSW